MSDKPRGVGGNSKKKRGKEEEEMTFGLLECLRAVGLQHHYARFSSVGIDRAAHLSVLTMEDYPILGIHSMEDRTRLFQLIQMVKTLDLQSLEHEDGDVYSADAGRSFTYENCGASDEDTYNDEDTKCAVVRKLDSFSKSSRVSRKLDFSGENTHQEHLYHSFYNDSGQGEGSVATVQLDCNTDSASVCSCKGNNNHKLDTYLHQSVNTGKNVKPDITGGISIKTSPNRSSPQSVGFHKPKPKSAAVPSKKFRNKPVGHKNKGSISREEKVFTGMSCNTAFEHMCDQTPVYELKRKAGYNYGLPLSPPSLPDKKQSGGQRISVCVRKRPQTHVECRKGEADVVTTPSRECVIVHESKEAVDLTQYILQHKFFFDQVFGEESSNEEVYQRTAYPLVQHMLNGGKATCFAYGQTGSGKTHTMLGSSPRSPGLYALAVRDIFAYLSSTHMNSPLLVYVSFFEIYCGQLYDLLDHRKRLYAREDGQKVVHIAGMRDVRVDSVSSLLEVIAQGTEERTQGVSGVNPHSSRSHALLQIQLRDSNQQLAGRIWFVDLAGSERASDTKEPDRQSRMEGAEINQSLLALKECIRSLDQEQLHTPFRQSKLTQVLKDSFVGDSMTCMIANISPGHLASEHTLNTLRYADRVKELQGQGGLKRGRRGKLFPKCNVSKSSRRSSSSSQGSSVFMRGKSPPKKPKFGTSREAFIPTMRTMRLATGGPILCSTPKNCKRDEKTSTRDRKDIGLEQITPVKGVIRIGDNRKIATVRDRRIESDVGIDGASHLSGDQNIRESEIFCREWGNQSKEGREQERRQIEEKRQTQCSRDSYTGVERVKERDLGKEYGRDREKETHLRWYHQQLQQFTPSSVFSDSTCLSESSSHPASLSSSVFSSSVLSFQHSPHLSDSALTYQGLEDSSDDYIATVTVKAVVPLTSQHCNKDKDKVSHGDSGGRDVGSSREERRPAGLEGMRGRGWAWLPGCMTGVRPAAREAQVSYNCDSEQRREVGEGGSESSDVSAEGVWSNEEHESNDSCGYSTRPVVEMSNHRAPAERPLSPGCEHAITSLTPNKPSELPFRSNHIRWTSRDLHPSTQSSVTAEPSRSKEDLLFAADANKRELSNDALPPEDSFNCIMEPLSISLLQVDQQAATTSFLQGASKGSSPCPLDNEVKECSRRVNVHAACLDRAIRVGGEGEFGLSLLEMPQVKTHCPPISNPITSGTTEGRQEISGTTNGLHGLGTMTLPIPENKLDSPRDQKIYQKTPTGLFIENLPNNTSAAPVKLSLCALSKCTSVIQPTSSSTQPHKNKDAGNSHNAEKNGWTQTPSQHMHNKHPLPFSLTATKAVLGRAKMLPKQGATVHSVPSDNSDTLPQPNDWTSSKFQGDPSNQTTRNVIDPTLEDSDHAKWHVIQAHWKQLEDMEALWHKEGTLLCQQPDMAFSEYIHKLEEIMKKKAQCVHSMIAQLQPYLRSHHSNQAHTHNQEVDHHENTCIN